MSTTLSSGRCSSELDLRAASVRAQIEQKIIEIEAELHLQRKPLLNNSNATNDLSNESEVYDMFVKRSKSYSLSEKKDLAMTRLQEELNNAQQALKLKDEEVAKLAKVQNDVGVEIEELTASLFEEANNMVQDAYKKQAIYQKQAREANMSLSVLQEEVTALKSLFKTSLFHQRPSVSVHSIPLTCSSSICTQSYSTSAKDFQTTCQTSNASKYQFSLCSAYKRGHYETDPIFYEEFIAWRRNPVIDKKDKFVDRIYTEDIIPCMNFGNSLLSEKVLEAIEASNIAIEVIPKDQPLPKKCSLLDIPRFCHYRMNLGDNQTYHISSFCRNRITAICNLLFYLRYIKDGLVSEGVHEVYLEVLKLRKAIAVARLGLPEEQYIEG